MPIPIMTPGQIGEVLVLRSDFEEIEMVGSDRVTATATLAQWTGLLGRLVTTEDAKLLVAAIDCARYADLFQGQGFTAEKYERLHVLRDILAAPPTDDRQGNTPG